MNAGEHLVIVGGGPAGLATARAYRVTGGLAHVTIVNSEPYAPYNRPPLTKEFLRGEVLPEDLPLEDDSWYRENSVELRPSMLVSRVDRNGQTVELENGGELSYDALVLATGSEPIRLPVPGAEDPDILVMRTVDNSRRLQGRVRENGRVVVVGSGFIGCETAASLALVGADVTLISLEESPQRDRLGQKVGERIEGWLRGYGVKLRLGTSLESIERPDSGYELSVEGADTISAGTVLFATGVAPRTGLAAEAGLHVDGGVVTDSSMRTSAPNIFAVGDIARAYNQSAGRHLSVEHWGDALEHGRIAGTVISGGDAGWGMAPGFWSTIGDKTIKYWAWGDGWDEQLFEDKGEAFTVWYGKKGTLVGVLSHNADDPYERGRELIERGESLPG